MKKMNKEMALTVVAVIIALGFIVYGFIPVTVPEHVTEAEIVKFVLETEYDYDLEYAEIKMYYDSTPGFSVAKVYVDGEHVVTARINLEDARSEYENYRKNS